MSKGDMITQFCSNFGRERVQFFGGQCDGRDVCAAIEDVLCDGRGLDGGWTVVRRFLARFLRGCTEVSFLQREICDARARWKWENIALPKRGRSRVSRGVRDI